MKKIAVLTFPGMNCEVETARAIKKSGLKSEIILWNSKAKLLQKFDGCVLPGGFSFEDRGRSGMVASKEEILQTVKQMADQEKPILGICNGAQVLIESGLAPDLRGEKKIEASLGMNKRVNEKGKILGTGYFHKWVYIKSTASIRRSAFNFFDFIFHLPIAHGEGRFQFSTEIGKAILKNQQNIFSYCDNKGEIKENFPINPNGSYKNIAGISNKLGNVLALMPHPERNLQSCQPIFLSMRKYLSNKKLFSLNKKLILNLPLNKKKSAQKNDYLKIKKFPIQFFITLKITDNSEKTIEKTLQKVYKNQNIKIKRRLFWGFESIEKDLKKTALKIIKSGEVFNENKENLIIKLKDKYFTFNQGKLIENDFCLEKNSFLALEKENFIAKEKSEKISKNFSINLKEISHAIIWSFLKKPQDLSTLEEAAILSNPIAGKLIKIS